MSRCATGAPSVAASRMPTRRRTSPPRSWRWMPRSCFGRSRPSARSRPRTSSLARSTTEIARTSCWWACGLPPVPAGAGSAYRQITQPASGYSMVGRRGGGGPVRRDWSATSGWASPAWARSPIARWPSRQPCWARTAGADALAAAAAHAADGQQVNGDIHADAEYRTAMAAGHHTPGPGGRDRPGGLSDWVGRVGDDARG